MSKKAKRTHINNDDSTEEHEDFMRMLGTFMGRHKLKLDEAASCALICGFDALLISLKRRPEKDLSWENFSGVLIDLLKERWDEHVAAWDNFKGNGGTS